MINISPSLPPKIYISRAQTHTPAKEHLPRNNRKKGATINDTKFRWLCIRVKPRELRPVAWDVIKVPYGPINSDQPTVESSRNGTGISARRMKPPHCVIFFVHSLSIITLGKLGSSVNRERK